MLDHITVEAYGERKPLSSLAQVQLRSPTLFVLSPFDAAVRARAAPACSPQRAAAAAKLPHARRRRRRRRRCRCAARSCRPPLPLPCATRA